MRAIETHKKIARVVSCAECGCKFCPLYGSSNATLCTLCVESRKRAERSARKAIRRAKIGNAKAVDPFKVFDRDGWKCKLCGALTPKNQRGLHNDFSPELDHIKPLSKGGAHSYENTQLLCRRCNQEKTDKWYNEEENLQQALLL